MGIKWLKSLFIMTSWKLYFFSKTKSVYIRHPHCQKKKKKKQGHSQAIDCGSKEFADEREWNFCVFRNTLICPVLNEDLGRPELYTSLMKTFIRQLSVCLFVCFTRLHILLRSFLFTIMCIPRTNYSDWYIAGIKLTIPKRYW